MASITTIVLAAAIPKRASPSAIGQAETAREIWKFEVLHNLALLAVILGAVLIRHPAGLSECLMIAAAVVSYVSTRKETHEANDFNFQPIREVAWLFLGIFATMVPALDYLHAHARELGLTSDMAFFWVTGTLSSGLDNAPTYMAMLAAAMGVHNLDLNDPVQVRHLAQSNDHELIAISIGAVFFGAMTYIGNGPNFMVKSIADHSKVNTPGFFTYLFQYSIPILLPILYLIALLFFSQWKVF